MAWLSCVISNVVLASLLALTAWFLQRRPGRQAIARFLWVLVLVKLITPPLVRLPLRELPGAWACAIGACGCEQHARIQSTVSNTLPWILLAVWTIGAAATGWTAWRRWAHFRRLLAHATPAPAEWQALAARLSGELAISRPPEILAVPGRLPPLVVAGRCGPSMLLPADLMGGLSDSQRQALLLHELFHIKRRDHLMRILELTVRVAYWWLPFVGSIGRQLRDCEEACCDAAVLAHLPQARRDYASLLLDVLDFVAPLPLPAAAQITAMSTVHDVERRLRTILDTTHCSPHTPAVSFAAGALALGVACAILPCELHYDFVGRSIPASTSVVPPSSAGDTCLPNGDRKVDMFATMCCPS